MNGWTIGPGFETVLGGNWSAKLEYRYSQFGQTTLPGTNIALAPSNQAVRAGLSYRFGGLGVASSDAPATPPAPRKVNWTGIYAGVAGGAGVSFGRVNAVAGPAQAGFNSAGQGLLGSVFAGADYQFLPNALVGVMGDITFMGIQPTLNIATPAGSTYLTAAQNRQWSLMGRVGWLPVPSTLLYAAAGYSELNLYTTAAVAGTFTSSNNAYSGFTVGPGIETVVTGRWTTRLEYRYTQLEQRDFFGGASLQPANHTIRAGLSYKFGLGAGATVESASDGSFEERGDGQ